MHVVGSMSCFAPYVHAARCSLTTCAVYTSSPSTSVHTPNLCRQRLRSGKQSRQLRCNAKGSRRSRQRAIETTSDEDVPQDWSTDASGTSLPLGEAPVDDGKDMQEQLAELQNHQSQHEQDAQEPAQQQCHQSQAPAPPPQPAPPASSNLLSIGAQVAAVAGIIAAGVFLFRRFSQQKSGGAANNGGPGSADGALATNEEASCEWQNVGMSGCLE